MLRYLTIFITTVITLFSSCLASQVNQKSYIVADIYGQLGNNLFQVATASALAWDNNAEAYFPDLMPHPTLCQHVFSRCKLTSPGVNFAFKWEEKGFPYLPIPFHPNMHIRGYFQSEKYFAHHRQRLLELFAPTTHDLKYIRKKYSHILNHPSAVGIQLRYYFEDPHAEIYIQYGKDYVEKAMSHFPESSLFVVTSNNLDFARKNIPANAKNVIFLEEPHYICLYLLSLCKHNIITNSSFGWWAAWLNQNPNKIVIRPYQWLNGGYDMRDMGPESWIKVDAKKGRNNDPTSY